MFLAFLTYFRIILEVILVIPIRFCAVASLHISNKLARRRTKGSILQLLRGDALILVIFCLNLVG